MRARCASACAVFGPRVHCSSTSRSAALTTSSAFGSSPCTPATQQPLACWLPVAVKADIFEWLWGGHVLCLPHGGPTACEEGRPRAMDSSGDNPSGKCWTSRDVAQSDHSPAGSSYDR
jgi:hypothetical protein